MSFKGGKPNGAVIRRNARISLADQLNGILRRELKKFKSGDRFYTDREVCRKYGVSPPVTRKVLALLAADGLIRREVSRGTFVEKPRTPAAAAGKMRVTVFCPLVGYCPHSAAVEGIESVCRAAGYDVLIRPNEQSGGRVDLRVMADGVSAVLANADGVIWVGSILEELRRWPVSLAALARRLVCVNIFAATGEVTSVARDDAASAFQLTSHLFERGRREIGYIGGEPGRTSAIERHAGFVRAMQALNLPADAPWVIPFTDGMVEAAGRAAIRRLLLRQNVPAALVCVTDRMAAAAMEELQAADMVVPDDIAVVGFDNAPQAEQCRPALTSIDPRFMETGSMAARLLLDQIAGRASAGGLHKLPGRLVIRDSTGTGIISQSRQGTKTNEPISKLTF